MEKVVIFTEGSYNYGFGHITRCISLYKEFKNLGFEVEFLIKGGNEIVNILKDEVYKLIDWTEIENLEAILNNKDIHISIIDSYTANLDILKKIEEKSVKCLYIDDTNRIKYPRGIILNSAIYANDLDYKNDNSKLLGIEYCLLRPEFKDYEGIEKKVNKSVKNVLITLGGSDVKNITPIILKVMSNKYQHIKKYVVIGNGFNNIDQIEEFKDSNTNIIMNADSKKMSKLMIICDFAISSGGQTMYELGYLNTPTIGICVAENQMKNINKFKKEECAITLYWENLNEDSIKNAINEILKYDNRYILTKNMNRYFKYYGAEKVAKYVTEYKKEL